MPCKKLLGNIDHPPNGKLKDVLAVLMDIMHFLFNGFRIGGMKAAPAGHVKESPAAPVATQDVVNNSALAV